MGAAWETLRTSLSHGELGAARLQPSWFARGWILWAPASPSHGELAVSDRVPLQLIRLYCVQEPCGLRPPPCPATRTLSLCRDAQPGQAGQGASAHRRAASARPAACTSLPTSRYLSNRLAASRLCHPRRCKRNEVPMEKVFNKSLLTKFLWAMDVEPDFRF